MIPLLYDMTIHNKYRKRLLVRAGFLPVFILLFFLILSSSAIAQCVGFARAVAKPELKPFLHDGNYNATILGEGETIVLRKTVFEGQNYRILVKGVPGLPGLRYRLLGKPGNEVLFDNAEHDYQSYWDFDVQTTSILAVEVTVLEDDDPGTSLGGCVAILFGLDIDHK